MRSRLYCTQTFHNVQNSLPLTALCCPRSRQPPPPPPALHWAKDVQKLIQFQPIGDWERKWDAGSVAQWLRQFIKVLSGKQPVDSRLWFNASCTSREHELCCLPQGLHRLVAAKQLLRLNFCRLEARPDVRSYDRSHYALWQQPTIPFSKKDVPPSCSVHREENNLVRSRKQNIQFHHPSTSHFSHFQSDLKPIWASAPPFINTRVKNFRYCPYTDISSSIKIWFRGH